MNAAASNVVDLGAFRARRAKAAEPPETRPAGLWPLVYWTLAPVIVFVPVVQFAALHHAVRSTA